MSIDYKLYIEVFSVADMLFSFDLTYALVLRNLILKYVKTSYIYRQIKRYYEWKCRALKFNFELEKKTIMLKYYLK